MKNLRITASLILILLSIGLVTQSYTDNKQPDTKVLTSNSVTQLKPLIESYTKVGYKVQSIACQGLTNTYGGRTSCTSDCNIVKGDIIVILVKY